MAISVEEAATTMKSREETKISKNAANTENASTNAVPTMPMSGEEAITTTTSAKEASNKIK